MVDFGRLNTEISRHRKYVNSVFVSKKNSSFKVYFPKLITRKQSFDLENFNSLFHGYHADLQVHKPG